MLSIEEIKLLKEKLQKLKGTDWEKFLKEQKKFVSKFSLLNVEKARVAKSQNINKEILTGTLDYKI